MRNGLNLCEAGLVGVLAVSLATGAAGQVSEPPAAVLKRLLALPHGAGQSSIRLDYDASRDRTRIWIDSNEDDTRLWSSRGAQIDAEFRISAFADRPPKARMPATISWEIATLGELQPAGSALALNLRADGRPVVFTERIEPAARSGTLVFMASRVEMSLDEFLRLAASERVDGRIWGHEFGLLPSQLELLREYAIALAEFH